VNSAASQLVKMDVRAALREAIAQLERAQIPSARLAAELLLMHALGRDRAWLYSHSEDEIAMEARAKFFDDVARRVSGVPTQHLTGRQEFWGLDFEVTPDVLIPRPETEHIIEVALDRVQTRRNASPLAGKETRLRIADVGTGSGCLAIAMAKEFPNSRIIATDISAAALVVAQRNAARHNVNAQIGFLECNLLDGLLSPLAPAAPQLFDLIVSNPPYVALSDAPTLPREVRDHEPHSALFAGESGLDLYAPLIGAAERLLGPGGALVIELGYNAAAHVRALLENGDWRDISIANDLGGIARVASAIRGA
jgi:release factor glutamine methyltransferase